MKTTSEEFHYSFLPLKEMTFTNALRVRDAQWREWKSKREGWNASLEEPIINSVQDQRRRSAAGGFGAAPVNGKWRGQENGVGIRTSECTSRRVSCLGLVVANSQREREWGGMRWELRGAKRDQRHTGCMRSRAVWSFTFVVPPTVARPQLAPRQCANTGSLL